MAQGAIHLNKRIERHHLTNAINKWDKWGVLADDII